MKKKILILCAFGFMMACSGTTQKAEAESNELKEQIEAIELTNYNLEVTIDSLELEVETLQAEIENLLKDI